MILHFLNFYYVLIIAKHKNYEDDNIKLPLNMIIPCKDDISSLQKLIDIVFLDIKNYSTKLYLKVNRVIFTPKNDYVNEINNLLIERFPSDPIRYYSFGETLDTTEQYF